MGLLDKLKRNKNFCFSSSFLKNESFKNCLERCQHLNTNLVVASYYFCCDSETAKYRGRVFCIDGKDRRFPKLTDDVLKCKLSFSPFIYGVSFFEVYTTKEDPIKFSNRPFVDDRTLEEKKVFSEKYDKAN